MNFGAGPGRVELLQELLDGNIPCPGLGSVGKTAIHKTSRMRCKIR